MQNSTIHFKLIWIPLSKEIYYNRKLKIETTVCYTKKYTKETFISNYYSNNLGAMVANNINKSIKNDTI